MQRMQKEGRGALSQLLRLLQPLQRGCERQRRPESSAAQHRYCPHPLRQGMSLRQHVHAPSPPPPSLVGAPQSR
jgi:hypothetical protein